MAAILTAWGLLLATVKITYEVYQLTHPAREKVVRLRLTHLGEMPYRILESDRVKFVTMLDGKPVAEAAGYGCRVENVGELPISAADVLEPLRIEFSEATILNHEPGPSDPPELRPKVTYSGREIRLEAALLNPGDWFVVTFLASGRIGVPQVLGRIKDMRIIEIGNPRNAVFGSVSKHDVAEAEERLRLRRLGLLPLKAGLLGLTFACLALGYRFRESIRSRRLVGRVYPWMVGEPIADLSFVVRSTLVTMALFTLLLFVAVEWSTGTTVLPILSDQGIETGQG